MMILAKKIIVTVVIVCLCVAIAIYAATTCVEIQTALASVTTDTFWRRCVQWRHPLQQ